ncbi:progranulin [Nephila pilipes]|uniref:Progranulin n=1 Tax=Nephila pilipes TaxID=299642 RepID=A0A8X6Q012_NEPPI|nr:progranulin [Nephila pilipes]
MGYNRLLSHSGCKTDYFPYSKNKCLVQKMYFLTTLAVFSISSIVGIFGECDLGFCKNDGTCCPALSPTDWSCCDFPRAICCADMKHCCPEGTQCDLKSGVCYPKMKLGISNILLNSEPPKRRYEDDAPPTAVVQCDSRSVCLDDSTCCLGVDGKYGCCPYRHAQCCDDRKHCCRAGEKCDSTSSFCIQDDGAMVSSRLKKPAFS